MISANKLHTNIFSQTLGNYLKTIATLDLRSLATLRILIGVLILFNLADRSKDLVVHYTDWGILPRVNILIAEPDSWMLSIHMLNGSWQFQAFLFIVEAIFAVFLILGFRTRLVSFVSWLLLVSLENRNVHILSGADQVFRMVLFFGMFIPWGARFSLDVLRSQTKQTSKNDFASIGTLAYMIQIGFLYVFSAFFKTSSEWRTDGTAIYYSLGQQNFATRLGLFMFNFPQILRLQTHFVFIQEAIGPFFLLVPFFSGPIRTLLVFLFIGLHIGIGIHLRLGFFPWVCSFAWVGLLPGWFWDVFLVRLGIKKFLYFLIRNFSNSYHDFYAFLKNNKFYEAVGKWVMRSSFTIQNDMNFYKSSYLNFIAFVAIIYVLMWNFSSLPQTSDIIPRQLRWAGFLFSTYQRWNMFAPAPPNWSGWFVIPAVLNNGKQVDLYNNGSDISWDKPELVSATYKNTYWEKFMINLYIPKYTWLNEPYTDYLCREWNKHHSNSEDIDSLFVVYMRQETLPDIKHAPAVPVVLKSKRCS